MEKWNLIESTRQRVQPSPHYKIHEDRTLQVTGFTPRTHYNSVHHIIMLVPQAMNIPDCESCSGQGMAKARDNPIVTNGERQEKEGG